MQMLLLFFSDDRPIDAALLERLFQTDNGFHEVRFDDPAGAIIEAQYRESGDGTIVRLDRGGKSISLSGNTDAALNAALILQRYIQSPLRIIDADYSFDLNLADFRTVVELRRAMIKAQAD